MKTKPRENWYQCYLAKPSVYELLEKCDDDLAEPCRLAGCLSCPAGEGRLHRSDYRRNPKLLTPSLLTTLCEHAAGNLRLLVNLANDLLAAACHQERELLDEKLYFETFALDPKPKKA